MKTIHSKLALHGGEPVFLPGKHWPSWPIFDDTERKALDAVLESGKWCNSERVAEFQLRFATFQDAAHCVVCNSGTAALTIALRALGVGPGDEVIIPPYTFIGTVSPVVDVGAIPVFVDVDNSWNLNLDLTEHAITEHTKAIIPVHFAGLVCDMDRLNAIADRHSVWIIEDACHSWGAKWRGKGTGAWGHCGAFSFQASKNMTAGEGGAILTDDPELAEVCRSIVNCGRGTDGIWYNHVRIGTNARLSEFQAAILLAQLSRLEAQNLQRAQNAAILDEGIKPIEGLTFQLRDDPRITRHTYHLYCMRVDPERFGCSRDRVIEAAKAEGLPMFAGYARPLYEQEAFKHGRFAARYASCRCPVAEDLCYSSGLMMEHRLLLASEEDMHGIVQVLSKIKDHAAELNP